METASTWDSYRDTLIVVLETLNPVKCLEFGAGKSTKLISEYKSVKKLDSVENDYGWIEKVKKNGINEKVKFIYEPNLDSYPFVSGRFDLYHLIFIDGAVREKCLLNVSDKLDKDGVVVLHDAERKEYAEAIDTYLKSIWTDGGHTVILTDNIKVADGLSDILGGAFV